MFWSARTRLCCVMFRMTVLRWGCRLLSSRDEGGWRRRARALKAKRDADRGGRHREKRGRTADPLSDIPRSEAAKVYVDSGSSDGSPETATRLGAEVVYLSAQLPFTAARARNQGFERLERLLSSLEFVQFVDGDCELDQAWVQRGLSFLHQHPEVAAVAGRRRERFPEQSVYNWLCDRE